MGVINASILTGATFTPSGGTALAFVPDGRSVSNGVSQVVASDTNLVLRRSLELRSVLPAYAQSSNGYARMGKNTLLYRVPYLASDGKLYSQPMRIEFSFHPDYPNKADRISEAACFLTDSDFTNFWSLSTLT